MALFADNLDFPLVIIHNRPIVTYPIVNARLIRNVFLIRNRAAKPIVNSKRLTDGT